MRTVSLSRLGLILVLVIAAHPAAVRAGDCPDQVAEQGSGVARLTFLMPAGQEFVPARRMPLERFEYQVDDFNPYFPQNPIVLTLHQGTLDGPPVPGGTVSTVPDTGIHGDLVPFVFDEPLLLTVGETYVAEIWTDTDRWGMSTGSNSYPYGGSYAYGELRSTDYGFRSVHVCTVAGDLACSPSSGTLPFTVNIALAMTNNYTGQARRVAGNFGIQLAQGTWFGNLRSGYRNLGAGETYPVFWNQNIPNLVSLQGTNEFRLLSEDVTPAPYNQPPYPASGDTDVDACTVIGIAP